MYVDRKRLIEDWKRTWSKKTSRSEKVRKRHPKTRRSRKRSKERSKNQIIDWKVNSKRAEAQSTWTESSILLLNRIRIEHLNRIVYLAKGNKVSNELKRKVVNLWVTKWTLDRVIKWVINWVTKWTDHDAWHERKLSLNESHSRVGQGWTSIGSDFSWVFSIMSMRLQELLIPETRRLWGFTFLIVSD
jgi:hypothetical protein